MVHGADMARRTHADATRHARPCGRAARAHAARKWRTGGTQGVRTRGRPHESTWMPGWHHVARGMAGDGPTS